MIMVPADPTTEHGMVLQCELFFKPNPGSSGRQWGKRKGVLVPTWLRSWGGCLFFLLGLGFSAWTLVQSPPLRDVLCSSLSYLLRVTGSGVVWVNKSQVQDSIEHLGQRNPPFPMASGKEVVLAIAGRAYHSCLWNIRLTSMLTDSRAKKWGETESPKSLSEPWILLCLNMSPKCSSLCVPVM